MQSLQSPACCAVPSARERPSSPFTHAMPSQVTPASLMGAEAMTSLPFQRAVPSPSGMCMSVTSHGPAREKAGRCVAELLGLSRGPVWPVPLSLAACVLARLCLPRAPRAQHLPPRHQGRSLLSVFSGSSPIRFSLGRFFFSLLYMLISILCLSRMLQKIVFQPILCVSRKEEKSLSRVRIFATPGTTQSMEFSRPEHWSG